MFPQPPTILLRQECSFLPNEGQKERVDRGRTPSRRTYRGFTLIELLAVIGIIAVLAALLFPAMGKVFKQGRATVCLANLRQLGAGAVTYAADNGGRMYPSYTAAPGFNSPWWTWQLAIGGYLPVPTGPDGVGKTWVCPEEASIARSVNLVSDPSKPIAWTYLRMSNSYPFWEACGTAGDVLLSQIETPNKKIFLIDGVINKENQAGNSTGALTHWGIISGNSQGSGQVAFVHGGRANALFCDWHVESLKRDDITQAMCDNPYP